MQGGGHHRWYLAKGRLRSTQPAGPQLGCRRLLRSSRAAITHDTSPTSAEEQQRQQQQLLSPVEALQLLGLHLADAHGQLASAAAPDSTGAEQADQDQGPGLAGVAAAKEDGTFLGLLCCTTGEMRSSALAWL
jgi:hypothetical protein